MKSSFLLAFVCLLNITASVYSQNTKLTFEVRETTIRDVFKLIESQSEFRFFYNDDFADLNKRITYSTQGAIVEDILKEIFVNMDVSYKVLENNLIVIGPASELKKQGITVSGTVTDVSGMGIPGVTVMIKGTLIGTATNVDGSYSLNVPGTDAVLVFSFVGYATQEIEVGDQININVTMGEDVQQIEEVVVIGYGTARRSDVTGAIASVQSSTLSEVPTADAAQALQGRVAGVDINQFGYRPGAETQIRIRGTRSLSASNDPLIVVDGIPFSGTFNQIATDDIKSIDILKDASATAIYGSRGANGVIIITTYRGEVSKPQVTYSGYYGINTISKKYKMMSPEDFITMRLRSGYQQPNPWLPQEQPYFDSGSKYYGKSYDWQDEMYQTGAVTNHDLSIRGGNQTLQGSLGFSYFNETATLPGPEFTRLTVRGSVDIQANKWFKIGLSTNEVLNFNVGENVNQVVMGDILQFSPLVNPYDEDGKVVQRPMYPREDIYSPLLIKDKSLWSQDRRRFSTTNSIYAEIQFMPELRYRMNLGLNYSHEQYGTYYSQFSNQRSGAISTASIQESMRYSYLVDHLLYYDKEFQRKHRIGATAMFSLEDGYNESVAVSGEDLVADYMKYHNLSYANQRLQVSSNSRETLLTRRVLISYMGRFIYSYDGKYILTVTGRADGASVLSEGKKWHFYPAVNGAWNVYRESFMAGVNMVDLLKLRIGYGQTSNQSVSPYNTMGALSRNSYFFGNDDVYGYYPSAVGNPNLGWEYTNSYNLGVDFGLWKRLSGNIDIYLQKTYDLLVSQSFPASSGQSGRFMNNTGKTQNKGIEFTLRSDNILPKTRGGFRWSSDLNLSRNRNEIVELPGKVERDVGNGWFVGQPIDVIYDLKKIGIWQLGEEDEIAKFNINGHVFAPGEIKLLDVNGDYRIDTNNDRVIYGSFEPDFTWGFTNRFSYKDFDLTMVMYGQVGGTLVSTLHQNSYLNFLSGRYNQLDVDYWWDDNPTNDHPKPQFLGGIRAYYSTMGYFDATFLRIRTMTLGYTLPREWLRGVGISEFRVYATCNNVATLFSPYMKYGGVDPQPTGTGTQTIRGNVSGSVIQDRQMSVALGVPPTRVFLFGVNIKL